MLQAPDVSPAMILARTRFAALLMLTLVLVVAVITREPWWRVAPLACAIGFIAVANARTGRVVNRLAVNAVVIGPCTMTLLTGGLASPFCAMLVVATAGSALATGPVPGLIVRVGVGIFTIAASVWLVDTPGFVPLMFDRTHPTGALLSPIIWASALAILLVTFAVTMARSRAHLDATRAHAVNLQTELAQGLRDRNRELTAISGSLAHELKNPLASIQGLATHMAHKAEGPLAEQFSVMVTEIHRMGGILDGLLDVARPLGSLTLNTVALRGVIDATAQLHGPFAAAQGVTLSTAGEAHARVDVRKITQVVVNMLLNAIEAGATAVELKAGATADGSFIAVVDDGRGFEGDVARFFTSGTTTKDTGSGLGLAISAALAEQHGGHLTLTARPQGGCEARLTLPREIA